MTVETVTIAHNTDEKSAIFQALRAFVYQRPGLDPRDYGGPNEYYNQDKNSISQDLRDFNKLYDACQWRNSISAEDLQRAFRMAFSGRLSWDSETFTLDYCTGQYTPMEYRKAACAVLASVLWDYTRQCIPSDASVPGAYIRAHLKKEFGPAIGRRWFDCD